MIANPKKFTIGALLISAFIAVLIIIFMPLFNGQNGLSYLDSLYNSISKGSAYYIPKLRKESQEFSGLSVSVALTLRDERQVEETIPLLAGGGARVDVSGTTLKIRADLGKMIANCLQDADIMFANNGKRIYKKYGYSEKRVLYNWWMALKAMDKELKKQKKFAEAKFIVTVSKKAVECAYNYYKVAPQNISDKYGLVILSLVFYVVYTLWYGFAIMNLFEGLGLRLEH